MKTRCKPSYSTHFAKLSSVVSEFSTNTSWVTKAIVFKVYLCFSSLSDRTMVETFLIAYYILNMPQRQKRQPKKELTKDTNLIFVESSGYTAKRKYKV